MIKNIFSVLVMSAPLCLPAFAQKDENNRIENAGKVMVKFSTFPTTFPRIFWTRRTA